LKRPLVEISVEGVDGLLVAQDNGADRVELCASVLEGGITPSIGIVREALRRSRIPVFVIVRPRGGDFLYSEAEFESMRQDVIALRELGVPGVVTGCLTASAQVDEQRTAELLRLARPMSFTFHRAFDVVRDPLEALEVLVDLGGGSPADQRTTGHCPGRIGQSQATGASGTRAHDRDALRLASCGKYRPGVPGNRAMGTALCRS
jgi:copper homeostasis protein